MEKYFGWDDLQEWLASAPPWVVDAVYAEAKMPFAPPLKRGAPQEEGKGKSYAIPPGPGSARSMGIQPYSKKASKEKEKEDYSNSKFKALFLAAALDKMRGKEGTPAPVVTGSPNREFPTMARMMTPMEQQKPYWWIR
jgi:hypothetical protein